MASRDMIEAKGQQVLAAFLDLLGMNCPECALPNLYFSPHGKASIIIQCETPRAVQQDEPPVECKFNMIITQTPVHTGPFAMEFSEVDPRVRTTPIKVPPKAPVARRKRTTR